MVQSKNKWREGVIIAWDGEGINVNRRQADGSVAPKHVYNLLSNSLGDFIHDDTGLETEKCFELFYGENRVRAIHVIFGGSYDVNMILGDLTKDHLLELWHDGRVEWRGPSGKRWRICYTPRKRFSLALWNPERWNRSKNRRGNWDRSFVLWDVFGFFQSSFVEAIRKWLGNTTDFDYIQYMKMQRSTFTSEQFDDILHYNLTECKLLVQLVQELIRCLEVAEIRLRRYDGAGSIAAALMQQWGVKQLIAHPKPEMLDAIRIAYSGGRIEAPKIGNTKRTVWRYDVNSAYPSSACTLPLLRDARWELRAYEGHNDIIDWDCAMSLAHVRYNLIPDKLFYPLFTRWPDNSIKYCSEGEGWFWRPELELLRDFFKSGEYDVLECWNAYVDKVEHPLDQHIQDTYAKRMYFKSLVGDGRPKGHMAQEGLKLGMNSIYGKFAQQQGYREAIPGVREARYPSYHDLAWAGIITSHTRAKLFRAAMQAPNDVIAFATDAVFTFSRLDLPVGKNLGEWDETEIDAMTIVQPGVYWLKLKGEWESKYRGFDRNSIDRELVVDKWRHGEDTLMVTLTRFITMGAALKLVEYDGKWRSWDVQPRALSLVPQGKRMDLYAGPMWAEEMCDTMVVGNAFMEMSKAFNLRWAESEEGGPEDDYENNPFRLRDIERQELEDSFL